jgi:hypothetical protein
MDSERFELLLLMGNCRRCHRSPEIYGMNSNAPMSGRAEPFPSPSTTRGFPAKSVGGRLGTDKVPASIAGEVGWSWKLRLETKLRIDRDVPVEPGLIGDARIVGYVIKDQIIHPCWFVTGIKELHLKANIISQNNVVGIKLG